MQLYIIIFFILQLNHIAIGLNESDGFKLQQLQVLFRHGDRTPNDADIFVDDPYDEIYQSYGYGQLTKIGKKREHKIGQFLRERYDAFLGEYRIDDVHAYSSDSDRTKMSLQLLLAGLYPPSESTSWSSSINWQPIPNHYEDIETSFISTAFSCPKFMKQYHEIACEAEMLEEFEKHRDFFQHIENHTGITISKLFTLANVHSNLRSAISLGLPLPDWCSQENFVEIERITGIAFDALTYNEQLRRTIAGPVVEQFLKVLNDENAKKIYLYGGHDMNVASIINAHNITGAPVYQDFGSSIVLEKLKGPDDKIYIRTGVSEEFLSLKLPNCETTCLLSDYEKIVQPILPNNATRMCHSLSYFCTQGIRLTLKPNIDWRLSYLFAGSDLASFRYSKNVLPPIEMWDLC